MDGSTVAEEPYYDVRVRVIFRVFLLHLITLCCMLAGTVLLSIPLAKNYVVSVVFLAVMIPLIMMEMVALSVIENEQGLLLNYVFLGVATTCLFASITALAQSLVVVFVLSVCIAECAAVCILSRVYHESLDHLFYARIMFTALTVTVNATSVPYCAFFVGHCYQVFVVVVVGSIMCVYYVYFIRSCDLPLKDVFRGTVSIFTRPIEFMFQKKTD